MAVYRRTKQEARSLAFLKRERRAHVFLLNVSPRLPFWEVAICYQYLSFIFENEERCSNQFSVLPKVFQRCWFMAETSKPTDSFSNMFESFRRWKVYVKYIETKVKMKWQDGHCEHHQFLLKEVWVASNKEMPVSFRQLLWQISMQKYVVCCILLLTYCKYKQFIKIGFWASYIIANYLYLFLEHL